MSEHTPTPWNAASAYSSICGVPIISQKGGRVGNTALPDMPKEWDELKQRAVADAAFICKAVNNHDALEAVRKAAYDYFMYAVQDEAEERECCVDDEQHELAKALRDALAVVGKAPQP